MTRKDTILIAILVNAGLLMILFVTAISPTKEGLQPLQEAPAPIALMPVVQMPVNATASSPLVIDEIDAALDEHVAKAAVPLQVAPAAQVVAAVEMPATVVAYTVKKGDILERIAKEHSTTPEAIMTASKLANSKLKIGQVLKVPTNQKGKATPKATGKNYTVQSGDNPWLIAIKHGIEVEDLLAWNKLDAASAKKLRPGDQLKVAP